MEWYFKGNVLFLKNNIGDRKMLCFGLYILHCMKIQMVQTKVLMTYEVTPISNALVGKMRSADMQKGGNIFVLNGK